MFCKQTKIVWYHCDWSNFYDSSRPTESQALANIKAQAKLVSRVKSNKLSKQYRKIMSLEINHLTRNVNNTLDSAITEISKKIDISEIKVREILNYCTVWCYYQELLQ